MKRVEVKGLRKSFTLHHQGGANLAVLDDFTFDVASGECVALTGPSGAGKSTVLKCIHGTYRADAGRIEVRHEEGMTDVASASPREVIALRRDTIGYVSQFLRVIPRVSAERVVAEELCGGDTNPERAALALAEARALLARLGIGERLAALPPATFSGGEQQRVNIARGFVRRRPLLLLDEPTASLDAVNRAVVVSLVREARDAGCAIVGIFHDESVRRAVADRVVDVPPSTRGDT